MARSLEGRTLFMSGGSRGIGLAIAVPAARDGANVEDAISHARRPEIVADAAYEILTSDETGNCFVDDEVVPEATDLESYRVDPTAGDVELDSLVYPGPTPR